MSNIEISLSKSKLLFGIGGSILFVVLGLYLFATIADHLTSFNPTLVKIVGMAGIVFFDAPGIYGIMKMFGNNNGLTIDNNGFLDTIQTHQALDSFNGLTLWK